MIAVSHLSKTHFSDTPFACRVMFSALNHLILGPNSAPFPMPKSMFFSQFQTNKNPNLIFFFGSPPLFHIDFELKKVLLPPPPPPLGNFADISYLEENFKPHLLRDVCTLCSGALVSDSLLHMLLLQTKEKIKMKV